MITAARCTAVSTAPIAETDTAPPRAAEVDLRTRELLRGLQSFSLRRHVSEENGR